MIGRAAEFGVLLRALDRAAAGHANAVVVSGDAGVGKTRLVAELAAVARERGCTVLLGQCAELGESMPYLPLADALWTATRDQRRPRELRDRLHAALDARPVLRRLLPDGEAASGGESTKLAQQQLFGATLGLLGELADDHPVLLVLEDLHWSDQSTRDLLTFLSRVLQRERVCVIATYRSDDLHRRHPLRPVIAELLRLTDVAAVEVRPFALAETADFLAMLDGSGAPPHEVVQQVHTRSEGNPFYAAELYTASHEASRAGEELPAGLADLLLSRVERLSDEAQRVVRVAAVAGRRINDELVRQVSGLDEAVCERALREIVSHQILLPYGPDGYMFRHALLREAIYGDLLPGENTRLHSAFAALLAAAPPGRRNAAELAYHSLAAHDLAGAFEASVEAGRTAERIGAPSEAYEHYTRALSLWERIPEAVSLAGVDRPRLVLLAVQASGHSGHPRRALKLLHRLLEHIDPADRALAAEVRERLAYYFADLSLDTESQRMAQSAVDVLPADPPTPQRARALATLTRSVIYSDRHEEIPALAEETIATARATEALDAEASALVSLGLYTESRDADPGVVELFAKAIGLGHDLGDPQVVQRAAYQYARAKFDRGDLAGAVEAVDEGVRYTLEKGLAWSGYGASLRCLQFLVHYTTGEWERARELADGFGIRVDMLFEAQVSSYALVLEVAQGDPAVAERLPWLATFYDHDDPFISYMARGLAAENALWNGDTATGLTEALASLAAISEHEAGVIRIAATTLWALADQAVLARTAGDSAAEDEAVRTADALVERARAAAARTPDGNPRAWLGLEGKAWLARAEAEWHRARDKDDPVLWAAIVEAFDYGYVYEVARSRWRLAESLTERGEAGDREEATRQWRLAMADATRLGALPLRRALQRLGSRARLSDGQPAAAPPPGPLTGLTSREVEVLRLVAEGRNNREIAAALFISPKTASVHVSNILAKLGASSRTQAAAIAHRSGLLQP